MRIPIALAAVIVPVLSFANSDLEASQRAPVPVIIEGQTQRVSIEGQVNAVLREPANVVIDGQNAPVTVQGEVNASLDEPVAVEGTIDANIRNIPSVTVVEDLTTRVPWMPISMAYEKDTCTNADAFFLCTDERPPNLLHRVDLLVFADGGPCRVDAIAYDAAVGEPARGNIFPIGAAQYYSFLPFRLESITWPRQVSFLSMTDPMIRLIVSNFGGTSCTVEYTFYGSTGAVAR